MGDRTYCTLCCYRDTPLTHEEATRLLAVIKEEEPDNITRNLAGFQEVNYGEIPIALNHILEELNISYQWYWGTGGGYNSGVRIFDAMTQESEEFDTINSEIVISVECALEDLEHARAWSKRFENRPGLILIPE